MPAEKIIKPDFQLDTKKLIRSFLSWRSSMPAEKIIKPDFQLVEEKLKAECINAIQKYYRYKKWSETHFSSELRGIIWEATLHDINMDLDSVDTE
jgi:hypothetical protein